MKVLQPLIFFARALRTFNIDADQPVVLWGYKPIIAIHKGVRPYGGTFMVNKKLDKLRGGYITGSRISYLFLSAPSNYYKDRILDKLLK